MTRERYVALVKQVGDVHNELELRQHDAEQREEIRLLSEQVNVANKELLKRAREITRLQTRVFELESTLNAIEHGL